MPRFMVSAKLHELKEKFYQKNLFLDLRLNSKGWLIFIISITAIALVMYLWQVNNLATKGYEIKGLEEKVGDLREKNKKFELEIAQLRSTERINQALEKLEMVEVARVEYLKANGTSVAVNR